MPFGVMPYVMQCNALCNAYYISLSNSLRNGANPAKSCCLNALHVGDAEMPADFLTKWVSAKKLERSLAYVTNQANRLEHPKEAK